ncbi:hypothetical protein BaRGS_00003885 [Batillaria attramentaria]|uniref:Apple domain-containing protein n=1 Tax=Batillaria attramentaria TaxID=370345 RepID=A0ABD0LZB3_9CAEN
MPPSTRRLETNPLQGFYVGPPDRIALCAYTDLQPTFIKYPGYAIDGFNMKSSEDCMDQCIANPRCRSMEHVTTSKGACRLQPVTKLGAADSVWRAYSDWNYYQRTCL